MVAVYSRPMTTFLKSLANGVSREGASFGPLTSPAGRNITLTAKDMGNGWYNIEKAIQVGDRTITGHLGYNCATGILYRNGVVTETPRGEIVQNLTNGRFCTPQGYYDQVGKVSINGGATFGYNGRITNPQDIVEIEDAPRGLCSGGRIGKQILMPEQLKNIVNYILGKK